MTFRSAKPKNIMNENSVLNLKGPRGWICEDVSPTGDFWKTYLPLILTSKAMLTCKVLSFASMQRSPPTCELVNKLSVKVSAPRMLCQ